MRSATLLLIAAAFVLAAAWNANQLIDAWIDQVDRDFPGGHIRSDFVGYGTISDDEHSGIGAADVETVQRNGGQQ